jgi:hypothetical protein
LNISVRSLKCNWSVLITEMPSSQFSMPNMSRSRSALAALRLRETSAVHPLSVQVFLSHSLARSQARTHTHTHTPQVFTCNTCILLHALIIRITSIFTALAQRHHVTMLSSQLRTRFIWTSLRTQGLSYGEGLQGGSIPRALPPTGEPEKSL